MDWPFDLFFGMDDSMRVLPKRYAVRPEGAARYFKSTLLVLLSSVLCLIASPHLRAEEESGEQPDAFVQVWRAYGYLTSQGQVIDQIAVRYPDMKEAVDKAKNAFAVSDFGKGGAVLEATVREQSGEEWPEVRKELQAQIAQTVAEEKLALSRDYARGLISDLEKQAKGEGMQDDLRRTLLSVHPAFKKSPAAEMTAGWRQSCLLADSPRSEKCPIAFEFPMSWAKRDGDLNGVVHVLRSFAGSGRVACALYSKKAVDDSAPEATVEMMGEVFSKDFLARNVPKGAKLIAARPTTIAKKPGGLVIYDADQDVGFGKVPTRNLMFSLMHKRHMVQFQFAIMVLPEEKLEFDALEKQFFPCFQAIIDTVIRK